LGKRVYWIMSRGVKCRGSRAEELGKEVDTSEINLVGEQLTMWISRREIVSFNTECLVKNN